jgi:putative transposase
MIWTPTGLRQAFVLAFIHVGTRRVFCSPCSFKPDAKWMVRQAHSFVEQAREAGLRIDYLIRDRDGKYVREFDQVFKDIGCRIEPTAPQSPNQNAFIERWVKSMKFECLNYFIVFGKKHLDHLVSCYTDFYNELRHINLWTIDRSLGIGLRLMIHSRLRSKSFVTKSLADCCVITNVLLLE